MGQTDFVSAAPPGGGRAAFGTANAAGAAEDTAGKAATPSSASSSTRTVQETDLYRLDGNRLYYLNAYRGLMVFDLTDVDHPKFLGRSPIVGSPVQMYVQNGIAVVVVADWYGQLEDGSPFRGSIVRGLDANDPSNIKLLGEAKLGGWIQDLRVVGDVLYAVSEDYGWEYGWYGVGDVAGTGVVGSGTTTGPSVIVSSVNFAGGNIAQVSSKTYPGYSGVFNVTPSSIMLAHPAPAIAGQAQTGTELRYLDISDPAGAIVERGVLDVPGQVQGWGADNGRWNLDFADGKIAHTIGCADGGCGDGYVLSTADFTNPDAPALASTLPIAATGWGAAARFDGGRMYLSPDAGYYNTVATPLEIYDLTNPAAPALAGSAQISGSVWLMIPSGNQLFALGSSYSGSSSQVALQYLDVTNASAPSLLGTSTFGGDWAWTPAAGTFKAFTKDDAQGLVVLPFSGWNVASQQYNNGVQLIEFTPTTLTTAGAAHTRGWVERGILANGRIVSLSDLALSVVDYSNPMQPSVTAELTLARNVVATQPLGSSIAEVSSDWWNNDLSKSEVRVLPASDPAEIHDQSAAPDVSVPGVNGRVFTNGSLLYLVTSQQVPAPCPGSSVPDPAAGCTAWQESVQVVDASNGTARARGSVALPMGPNGYGGLGWYGYYYYDWYGGSEVVQVGSDALAFRRWYPNFDSSGRYVDSLDGLFVVDLSNPDAPSIGSTAITQDLTGWWGNMRVVGGTLYTTHYVWPEGTGDPYATVRYYLDRIDLTDRAHPRVESSVNVPGMLVGGSASDPNVLYTIDYRWFTLAGSTIAVDDLDVVRVDAAGVAHLLGSTALDGWVGNVVVQGTTAYTSTQRYQPADGQPLMELHQIDLSDPAQPRDYASTAAKGWGWLLDVQGDRAIVTSGWGLDGVDIYKVAPGTPPTYDQFVRTVGWGWVSNAARQDDTLFLTLGTYGVQAVNLR